MVNGEKTAEHVVESVKRALATGFQANAMVVVNLATKSPLFVLMV